MLERFRAALRELKGSSPADRRIVCSSEDVALVSAASGGDLWRVHWSGIAEIAAFKVDAVIVDHLCIGLRENGGTKFHVTDEETPGWRELVDELAARFGIAEETWFARVAFPPFEENFTSLWRSSDG
jgi:hypothetical protein